MITLTAAEERLLKLPWRAIRYRVSVHTRLSGANNAWRDLSTYLGVDWIKSVDVEENQDRPMASATIKLHREWMPQAQLGGAGGLSLVPRAVSRTNVKPTGTSPNTAADRWPCIDLWREIKIETAIVPIDDRDTTGTWREVFYGYIVGIGLGGHNDPTITLECLDLAAGIQRAFMEGDSNGKEITYASGAQAIELTLQALIYDAYKAPLWTTGAAKAKAAQVRPLADNGFYYVCSTNGTTHATTEPTWPTEVGATVADNTVVWTCAGRLPTVVLIGASPWVLRQFTQELEPGLEAMRRLAAQAAWDLRYRYDSGTATWRFELFDPGPTVPLVYRWSDATDIELAAGQYRIEDLNGNLDTVRNAGRIVFNDTANANRRTLNEATPHLNSILYFERRFFQLAEGANSNIGTASEAVTFTDKAQADMAWPPWEGVIRLPFWPAQLGDAYRAKAEGILFSSDHIATVFGFRHSLSPRGSVTTLNVLALKEGSTEPYEAGDGTGLKPLRRRAWLDVTVAPGVAPYPSLLTSPSAHAARAYRATSGQTLNGTPAALVYNTKDFDRSWLYDTTNGRATAQITWPHSMSAQVEATLANNATLYGRWYKNGTAWGPIESILNDSGGSAAVRVTGAINNANLVTGDYVQFFAWTDDPATPACALGSATTWISVAADAVGRNLRA